MVDVPPPGAPSVIRIKRKIDDIGPETLVVQRSKRVNTDQSYIFKRINQERVASAPVLKQEYDDDGLPKVRATPKGEEKRDPYATGRARKQPPQQTKAYVPPQSPAEPRRFHLSNFGAAAKGKSDVATFVERRFMARSVSATYMTVDSDGQADVRQQEDRKLKRPTARARTHRAATPQPAPVSLDHVDPSMAQRMDEWAQESSQQETQRAVQAPAHLAEDAMEVDNEADYVYDTYYRHQVTKDDVPEQGISFGHLVIEEDQEDLWETYLEGNESEDEKFDTDDEDSNAEDYYGADYPEDEVASDDEYDRDAYQFRKNADDLEEFDVHERYDSDHDGGNLVRSDDEGDFEEKLSAARAWRKDFGARP